MAKEETFYEVRRYELILVDRLKNAIFDNMKSHGLNGTLTEQSGYFIKDKIVIDAIAIFGLSTTGSFGPNSTFVDNILHSIEDVNYAVACNERFGEHCVIDRQFVLYRRPYNRRRNKEA